MPIAPQPFKYKCSKCGYSKIVEPKSDVLNPKDLDSTCLKCKSTMIRTSLNTLDKLFSLKLNF